VTRVSARFVLVVFFASGAVGECFEVGFPIGEEGFNEVAWENVRWWNDETFGGHLPSFWEFLTDGEVGTGKVVWDVLASVDACLDVCGKVKDVADGTELVIQIVLGDTVVENVADVVADAVFKVFDVFEDAFIEGAGAKSASDLVAPVVVLGDAEAEVVFEVGTVVVGREDSVDVEVVVEDCD